ncbi:hypothetical protein [Parasporobacterium paucivorans]|uniref:DUF1003 domain-containing protein n=1 Tax=Parasporobacterium paucivorans DSM 15970 TaxID=1122934 RepID=A0A1M6D0A9_9FIRM|nr:hypothetical protein [Parasporobacterium paucivorans]SHI66712.1 hypothetical protein SAMN02745691_00637 [Parasporobacterium paucivorans DSM 15970]
MNSVNDEKTHPNVTHPEELINKEFKGIYKFNYWLAVRITNGVGTMWCAYVFFILDLFMLPPVIKSNSVMIWVTYIAQTVLQLVLLPIIMVGQNVIQSQNEAKADSDHKTLTYLATLQDEQMRELKNQTEMLIKLEELTKNK